MKNKLKKSIFKFIKTTIFHIKTNHKKIKIAWFPKIDSKETLIRELSRCIWYLSPVKDKIEHIVFFLDEKIELDNVLENFIVPDYVDPSIAGMWLDLKGLVEFQCINKLPNISTFDLVIEWKKTLSTKQLFPNIIRADILNNQFEANHIIQASTLLEKTNLKKITKDNHNRFRKFVSDLKATPYESVLLIGSGPSVQKLDTINNDFSNSLIIVCNSIVKNNHIFNTYKPTIIVASDAVFHSGYSSYAFEFRKMVIQRMLEDQDLIFIVPLRDFVIYRACFPDILKERIIGIPIQRKNKYNFNISNQFYLKSTSNILTLMMMPLGLMLHLNIFLIGFDGRTQKDIDVFWSYDENSQFQTTYDATKIAHPAFYKVSYAHYYEKHCNEIDSLVKQARKSNIISIRHLTHSHIPALGQLNNG